MALRQRKEIKMTPTVTPTTLYILCYYIAGEAGGLIDGKVYSDPGDASFALATHRRNHHEGFATGEYLQRVEREWQSYVDLHQRGDSLTYRTMRDACARRKEWIEEHSWVSDKDIPTQDGDGVSLHIEERWSIADYTCWVREVSLVTASEQSKLLASGPQHRENKACSADVTPANELKT